MKQPTMTLQTLPKRLVTVSRETPRIGKTCEDYDDSCKAQNALACWMGAPECGVCPLLSNKGE
jgi:hypothetical protein